MTVLFSKIDFFIKSCKFVICEEALKIVSCQTGGNGNAEV